MGTYDSANAYGDQRLLLVWNRLIVPNGWSIAPQGMEGADPSGRRWSVSTVSWRPTLRVRAGASVRRGEPKGESAEIATRKSNA